LAAAVVAACSSSSSGAPVTPTTDAGDDATTVGDDGSVSTSCFPIGTPSCNAASGETCCFDIMALSGSCVQQSACTKSIQVACAGGSSCGAGKKCCADFGGISLAQVEDAGLGALGIDASALNADAGISGLTSGLGNLMIDVSCNDTCPTNSAQECTTTADCAAGSTCTALSALTGDAGAGDAGVPAGLAMYATMLGSTMVCVPPMTDGGTPTGDDSGVDSGPTVDAGTDAAPEAAP
jgi:hypothetical protein